MADDDIGKTVARGVTVSTGTSKTPAPHQLPTEPDGRFTIPSDSNDVELGRGGMGRVLRLHDPHLGRDVAVKELLPDRAPDDEQLALVFVREARVMALLEHPGVVPIYELGRRPDGSPYYAMRRVRGRTLTEALSATTRLEERLTLLPHYLDVAQTIAYAHSKKIVHRDLKPDNIMIGGFGETLVLDWGLALVDGHDVLGVTAGTPAYMSPEQARGERVDARSDVWSLGVMLFEIVAGQLPFEASTATEMVEAVKRANVPSLRKLEPGTPLALSNVVERALAREPAARFANGEELATALEQAMRARTPKSLAPWVIAGMSAALALGAVSWAVDSARDLDAERRVLAKITAEGANGRTHLLALQALSALREQNVLAAETLAVEALEYGTDSLAAGVRAIAEARGVPMKKWVVKSEAGCAQLFVDQQVVRCATLNGVDGWKLLDGAPMPKLSIGPRGWVRAVASTKEGLLVGGDDRKLYLFPSGLTLPGRVVAETADSISAIAVLEQGPLVGLLNGDVVAPGAPQPFKHFAGPARVIGRGTDWVAAGGGALAFHLTTTDGTLDRSSSAMTFDDQRIVLGAERSVVMVSSGTEPHTLLGARDDVTSVAAGRAIYSGAADGVLRWWRRDGVLLGVLDVAKSPIQSVVVTKTEHADLVIVATLDRNVTAYEVVVSEFVEPPEGRAPPVALSFDRRGFVYGAQRDGRVRKSMVADGSSTILELESAVALQSVLAVEGSQQPDAVRVLAGTADGKLIAQRWNGEASELTRAKGRIVAIAATKDLTRIALSTEAGEFLLFDGVKRVDVKREQRPTSHALAFSADAKQLFIGADDKQVHVLDATTGEEQFTFDPLDAPVSSLAISKTRLAVGSADGRVTLESLEQKKQIGQLTPSTQRIGALAFNADASLLAVGSDDGSGVVYELESRRERLRLPVDASDVLLVAFAPDGRLVLGGSDSSVTTVVP